MYRKPKFLEPKPVKSIHIKTYPINDTFIIDVAGEKQAEWLEAEAPKFGNLVKCPGFSYIFHVNPCYAFHEVELHLMRCP